MTTSPLSLTELYLLWSATLVIALAGLGVAVYAAWNSRRTRRLVLALYDWCEGVDSVIEGRRTDTVEQETVVVEAIDRLEHEANRPSPRPRVATVEREMGGRAFTFRANVTDAGDS